MYVSECLCVYVCHMYKYVQVHVEAGRGYQSPRAWVIDSCESPHVAAGGWTLEENQAL